MAVVVRLRPAFVGGLLSLLLSLPVLAADFTFSSEGPRHVVKGYTFNLNVLSTYQSRATDDRVYLTGSGTPPGSDIDWPYLRNHCCHTDELGFFSYEFTFYSGLQIRTSSASPTGSYPITITAKSGSTTKQVSFTMQVDPVPTAITPAGAMS